VIFSWDESNREHIAKHNVSPEEAEEIAENAQSPFPETIERDKLVVWSATAAGRYLQVIYVLKSPDEVAYESVTVEDWMDIEAGEFPKIVRVIHAMDLTPRMKRQLHRRRR
jgi:uncharacterized DUF497 family protein